MFSVVRITVAIYGKFTVTQRHRLIGASDPYPEVHIWCARTGFVKADWLKAATLAPPTVRWFASSTSLRGSTDPPPTSRRRRRESGDTCPLNGAYGRNGPSSFLHCCPHYSLKIPPKKRRRFSETFWPLSHVSSAQSSGRAPRVQRADVTWRARLSATRSSAAQSMHSSRGVTRVYSRIFSKLRVRLGPVLVRACDY